MALKVQVTISGDKQVIAKLRRLGDSLSDWSATLNNTGDYLMDIYSRLNFETQGGISGARWAELSPKYELWKAKNYPGRGILERTGALRKGFEMSVSPKKLEIINSVEYAFRHQEGKGPPVRKLINVNPAIKDQIINIFRDGIKQKLSLALR
jgi:hypothetical protein